MDNPHGRRSIFQRLQKYFSIKLRMLRYFSFGKIFVHFPGGGGIVPYGLPHGRAYLFEVDDSITDRASLAL